MGRPPEEAEVRKLLAICEAADDQRWGLWRGTGTAAAVYAWKYVAGGVMSTTDQGGGKMSADCRMVHARHADVEIVRYDRAGKWYLEPTNPELKRRQLKLIGAVLSALWAINNGGEVLLDRPGGKAFDTKFRALEADSSVAGSSADQGEK